MDLQPLKWMVNCPDHASLPVIATVEKSENSSPFCPTCHKKLLKCHMCFTTETETTAMGWDSLTHVQRTAAESDSGWHLERLEFMVKTDDKDSWLAHSHRSVELADKTTSLPIIMGTQSVSRYRGPWFTEKHSEQQSLQTIILSSGKEKAPVSWQANSSYAFAINILL